MTQLQTPSLSDIREHYDRLSMLYDRWWGNHIHHGYWEKDEDQTTAQVKLIEKLAADAGISSGEEVLDVGCGLGGSSLWLAAHSQCRVHGITISAVQAKTAASRARLAGLEKRVTFEVMDANQLRFAPKSFDGIWSIECVEHLYDKETFFQAAAELLRPGGKLALCTWLAAEEPDSGQSDLIQRVCDGMLCPGLGTMKDYLKWSRAAGFDPVTAMDITANVKQTWDRCARIIQRAELQALLRVSNRKTRNFANAFPLMQQAYADGAMRYGMFTSRLAP